MKASLLLVFIPLTMLAFILVINRLCTDVTDEIKKDTFDSNDIDDMSLTSYSLKYQSLVFLS